MAHDVFVSYSSKDKTAADAVVAALEGAGVRCWVAPRDILVGQEWAESILHAIESSKLMVLVFSDRANNSTHVRKEVERAVHHGLAVAPIRLTDALPAGSLEYFLSSSHWLDAMLPPLDQHLAELTRKVKLLLGETPKPGASALDGVSQSWRRGKDEQRHSLPPTKSRKNKVPLILGVASVVVLMVVGGLLAGLKFGWIGRQKRADVPVANLHTATNEGTVGTSPTSGEGGTPSLIAKHSADAVTPANGVVLPAMISVFTADDLVQSIAPNRILLLKSDEYNLTDVTDRQMEFVRWDRKFDGKTLTIRNVKNFSINGAADKPVRLIVRPGYVFVMNFEKCQDIHLANLVMGHAPQKGQCESGVLGATDCTGLTLTKCDLFGCGTEGLTLKNVKKLSFVDSTVRECTYGIMSLTGCTSISFTRSRFVGNAQFWGMKIDDCNDIAFSDCSIENNMLVDGSIFQATSSTRLKFEGGQILNNHASAMMEEADTVTIEGTKIEDNEFKRARP